MVNIYVVNEGGDGILVFAHNNCPFKDDVRFKDLNSGWYWIRMGENDDTGGEYPASMEFPSGPFSTRGMAADGCSSSVL
jgi:hypothetical protein